MKSKYISIIVPAFCLFGIAGASAQDLSGSLSAVGDYKAEIRPHTRLSGLPQRLSIVVPEASLPLTYEGVSIFTEPALVTQTAGIAGPQLPESFRGYVSLQAGSYLTNSLSAGYRFVDNGKTTLGAWLQHSCNYPLYRGETTASGYEGHRAKSYDETIGIYGSHLFDGAGRLDAAVAYRLGYFNCLTSATGLDGKPLSAPTQTLNDFKMSALWRGHTSDAGIFVDGQFSYRYFGYRRFFTPYNEYPGIKPPRENDLTAGFTVGYNMNEKGCLSLGVLSQSLFYFHPHFVSDIASNLLTDIHFNPRYQELRSYGVVSLTPRYSFSAGAWSLHAGAKVDLSWDVVSPEGFDSFHIAPDVAVNYANGKTNLYFKAGGGVSPNTLASRSEYFMYQSPALVNTLPQYSPLDATLGVKFGSFSGLGIGVHVSYAIANNTPTAGWYPELLAGLPLAPDTYCDALNALSLKGFSIGADLEYNLSSLLDVAGSVTYQRQSGKDGYFNGIDRPRWIIDAGATLTPIDGLKFGVTYQYRGVRRLYIGENRTATSQHPARVDHNYNGGDITSSHNFGYVTRRLKDIYDLGVNASYTLNNRYTFSVSADNILDTDDCINFLIPTPGLMITGGVQVVF